MKAAASYGVNRELQGARVCSCFRKVREVFWPGSEEFVEAVSFKEGVLKLRVKGSAWAQEVNMKMTKLRKRLDEELGEGKVREVFVKIM